MTHPIPSVKFICMGRTKKAEKEMTLVEHLEELRTRLIIIIIGAGIASIAGWFLGPVVLELLINDIGNVQVLKVTDAFGIRIKLAFWVGLIISSPLTLAQIWLFVAPGLYSKEKKFVVPAVFSSYILFITGSYFGLKIIPYSVKFLESFLSENMRPGYSIDFFINFAGTMIVAFAVLFQMPVVMVLLAKLGIVSYATISKNRKYIFLVLLIVSAVLTPADPISMIILAIPLYALFEISLLIIRFMKIDSTVDET